MPFIVYLRVSTQRQGQSGLGLEAQREAVEQYAARVSEPILGTFTEVESGAQKDRPELAAALKECRRTKSVLLIARLDRLSRSLSFIAQLLEAGVEIRAADMPEANRLMLQMLAVFAEHERRLISERTRAALAAAKTRGVELGVHGKRLAQAHRDEATVFARSLATIVLPLAAQKMSLRRIADELNARGLVSRDGGRWHPSSVTRLLSRLKEAH
ncbi:recombinase family protein [Caulobacter sp. BE264]|uniref:recombinase family protein n=1 Tax=Caulobacter sp. BE264 TaxID=2817724 RepID=UPI00286C6CB9|nr:recombinase family protein [Caulobacter sp. BE264]